jgi:hypothetical protein
MGNFLFSRQPHTQRIFLRVFKNFSKEERSSIYWFCGTNNINPDKNPSICLVTFPVFFGTAVSEMLIDPNPKSKIFSYAAFSGSIESIVPSQPLF